MGANDAAEMLAAAQAECVRLEKLTDQLEAECNNRAADVFRLEQENLTLKHALAAYTRLLTRSGKEPQSENI